MKFSIIVVAYNIENFVEHALTSCIFPGRDDYEVIVVENQSTDQTLKYVRRITDAHPGIFKVIENDENVGLGIGRNTGMAAATGDYVLFLDGDDWFAPTLLERLSPLIDSYSCDAYVFNHARAYDNGLIVRNRLSKILHEGPRDTPSDRANIMQNFGVAWNKAYKRSFIEANSLKFGERFYEDVDWNFEVLLLAETFFAIPDVLVYYRQRTGSITRSTDIRHFDILAQYHLVIELLKRHPDFIPNYGLKIYRYGFDQCLTVLKSDRLPEGTHNDYLRQFAELTQSFRATIGRNKLNQTERIVLRRNVPLFRFSLKLFRLYDQAEQRFKPVKAKIDKLKALIRKRAKQRLQLREQNNYRKLIKTRPLDDRLVLLEAYWGQKIDCNPYALAIELEKMGYKCLWSVHANAQIPPGYVPNTVLKYSPAYLEALATAKYLITNANLPDIWIKRPGQVHINTFHGTPLKYMGLDIIKTNPKEMDWTKYAQRSGRWDYAVSSNEYSTRVWRQNAPYQYRVLETGYPRNDLFFNATPTDVERIRAALGIPEGKKVALYAPTFRDADKNKSRVIDQSATFDASMVQQALGEDWVLLVRGHYFVRNRAAATNPAVIDASKHVLTNEVCLVSDLLITDYSSIMFDFACLKRPIALYIHDFEQYVAKRGMYFNIMAEPPGFVAEQFHELVEAMEKKAFNSPENLERLALFNRRFCAFDDGQAAQRLLAHILPNVETSSDLSAYSAP